MAECKFVDGNEEFLGKISEIFAEILFHILLVADCLPNSNGCELKHGIIPRSYVQLLNQKRGSDNEIVFAFA
ncbi:hypothetical protein Csa_019470 [Cucumis sativus]|uniref:Uncharacterized protein n=1 Tax=Cucumis sativus TaxID=3659 RepID=A0A0A0LF11_CUCSA|nr:hypothetical protein Csa_019470 [Cucumis sativus]